MSSLSGAPSGVPGSPGAPGVLKPEHLLNEAVTLHPEADEAARAVYELSPISIVRWAQCPRCRRRFWYALHSETSQQELWYHGAVVRQRLTSEPCAAHGGSPAPPAAAGAAGGSAQDARVLGVRVELFGVARLTAGEKVVVLPYADAGCLADVVSALAVRYPALVGPVLAPSGRALQDGYVFNLNGRDFVPDVGTLLRPGDTVLLVAAAAGG